MADLKLPELGENVEKGDVVRVLVAVGDVIKVDQPVVELETDKATIEVPSSIAGKVTNVAVKPGDRVKVGAVVLTVDTATEAAPAAPPSAPKAEAPAPSRPAAAAPAPAEQPAAPARPSQPKAPVVDISTGRQPAAAAAAPARIEVPPAPAAGASVGAAPSVRRYARELGVNIADVPGTGPGGRIGQDDVTAFVKKVMTGGGVRAGAAVARPALPDFSKWGPVDVKPMSNIRRKTAEHLTVAW